MTLRHFANAILKTLQIYYGLIGTLRAVNCTSSASYVASANLAELRKQLGERGELLEKLPFDELIAQRQIHEPKAISFMLELGDIQDSSSNKQKVRVLLFPPNQSDGQTRLQFSSYEVDSQEWVFYDSQNICAAVTDYTSAFKMSKKASRARCVALAKYYFLKMLAVQEDEDGTSELKFPFPINKSFIYDLTSACNEFKNQTKASNFSQASGRSRLVGSQDSDMTIDATLSERLHKQTPASRVTSDIPVAPQVPNIIGRDAMDISHDDMLSALADLHEKEIQIDADAEAINTQLDKLHQERAEMEQRRQTLENRRSQNEHEKAVVLARRNAFLRSVNVGAAYDLGKKMERTHQAKRRRLD